MSSHERSKPRLQYFEQTWLRSLMDGSTRTRPDCMQPSKQQHASCNDHKSGLPDLNRSKVSMERRRTIDSLDKTSVFDKLKAVACFGDGKQRQDFHRGQNRDSKVGTSHQLQRLRPSSGHLETIGSSRNFWITHQHSMIRPHIEQF